MIYFMIGKVQLRKDIGIRHAHGQFVMNIFLGNHFEIYIPFGSSSSRYNLVFFLDSGTFFLLGLIRGGDEYRIYIREYGNISSRFLSVF